MSIFHDLSKSPAHEKLSALLNIDIELQRRIGTFVVMSSMVEMGVETLAVSLKNEPIGDEPIWTDKKQISDLIKDTQKLCGGIEHADFRNLTASALDAINDMLTIRNTLVHGRPFSFTTGNVPHLLRNATWFGEKRTREETALRLDLPSLDRAIELMDGLHTIINRIITAVISPRKIGHAIEKAPELSKVRELAAEMKEKVLQALV